MHNICNHKIFSVDWIDFAFFFFFFGNVILKKNINHLVDASSCHPCMKKKLFNFDQIAFLHLVFITRNSHMKRIENSGLQRLNS